MNGHRTYLDLGRRTAPSTRSSQAIGSKWHRQWSNPPALGTLLRENNEDCSRPKAGGPTALAPERPEHGRKKVAA